MGSEGDPDARLGHFREPCSPGANVDDIMEWFDGLDRAQVKAVIEFAARSLDQPPVYAVYTTCVLGSPPTSGIERC
jgi:hypothetical protein